MEAIPHEVAAADLPAMIDYAVSHMSGPLPIFLEAVRDAMWRAERTDGALSAPLEALNAIAQSRGQTLAQMAIAWVLKDPRVTTALIGASKVSQIEDCVAALKHPTFSQEELSRIDHYAQDGAINLWAASSAG